MNSVFVLLEGRNVDINGYQAYDLIGAFEDIEAVEQWFSDSNTSEAYDRKNWNKIRVLDHWMIHPAIAVWEIKALGTIYQLSEIRVKESK